MGKARVASEIIDGIKTPKSAVTKTSEELGTILRGDANAAKGFTENAEEVLVRTEDIKNAKKAADFYRRIEEAKKKAEAVKKNSDSIPITPSASEPASVKSKKTFMQDTTDTVQSPKKELNRPKKYQMKRSVKEMSNYRHAIREARTPEEIKGVMEHYGLEHKEGMTSKEIRKAMSDKLRQDMKSGPDLQDYFYGYHGPEILGLGAVGGVAIDLFSSKGQRSNSQLYSDPFA